MPDPMHGTIRSFDGADGLGWIDLDDGSALRFGLSACKTLSPQPGLRVHVLSAEQRGSVRRATHIQPILDEVDLEERVWPEALQPFAIEPRWIDGVERQVRVGYAVADRDAIHARSPAWPPPAAFRELALPTAASTDAACPEPHPFFASWHAGIVETGVHALKLTADPEGTAGRVGGASALLAGPWPRCTEHGAMALLVSIEAATIHALVGSARRLTLHACVTCLNEARHAWLDERSNIARVEWSTQPGTFASEGDALLDEVGLTAQPVLSIPPAWTFLPRRDVEGHAPVGGVAPELFAVKLLRDRAAELRDAYEAANFVYDAHYTRLDADLTLGGFSHHPFALCRACAKPMRQLLFIHDYFCEPRLSDVFEGSNEVTLLACGRTPACGGPARGVLSIGP